MDFEGKRKEGRRISQREEQHEQKLYITACAGSIRMPVTRRGAG